MTTLINRRPPKQYKSIDLWEIDPDDDESIINFTCSQWELREQRYGGLYKTWLDTIAAYQGFFHLNYDLALRNYLNTVKDDPPWRVNLAINLLLPRIRTQVAKLLKTRPIFDVLPASNDIGDIDTAFLGRKVLQGIWYQQDYNLKFIEHLYWLALTGTAFSNPVWSPYSGQTMDLSIQDFVNQENLQQALQSQDQLALETVIIDAQNAFSAFVKKNGGDPTIFLGEVEWNIPSPFDIVTDDEDDFSKKNWLIHGTIRPISYYKYLNIDTEDFATTTNKDRQYRDLSKRVNMMSIFDNYYIHSNGLPGNVGCDQDEVVEKKLWLPRSPRFKKGFFAVVAGGSKVIYKGENPYDHKMIPYVCTTGDKVPGKIHGMSSGAQSLPEIRSYNAAKSAIVEASRVMGGNKWLVNRQSKVKLITNEVGELIEFQGAIPPTPVAMPNPPRVFMDLMMSSIRDVDEITAQREATRGQNPSGGRSAALTQNLQAQDESSLLIQGLYLNTTLSCTGRLMLSIAAQFYTEDRLTSYVGDNNKHVAFVIRAGALKGAYQNLPGSDYFNVRVTTFTQFGLDRAGQEANLGNLLQYGVFKPEDREKIFHWLDMGWFADEIDEFKRDRSVAHRENLIMAQGQFILPTIEQNQQVHIQEHMAFMNGEDFRQLPPQIQQMFRMHIMLSQLEQVKTVVRPQVYAQAAQLQLMGETQQLTGINLMPLMLGQMQNGGRTEQNSSKA